MLLLDEPLAHLDPLARHGFWRTLMDAVAETGLTVVLSSHLTGWEVEDVSLEDIVLAYLSERTTDRWHAPPSAREQHGIEVQE
jgi:ABC-type nitrate/sulfonate/bicarbonate transport system ATPase subunit